MDNVPLPDGLWLIWFDVALNRWPTWMLAAVIDAAVILERSAPPAQRVGLSEEPSAKREEGKSREDRQHAGQAPASIDGGARRATGTAIASDPSGERTVRSRIWKAGRPSCSAPEAGSVSPPPSCQFGACSES
jgi:hypothetical protein